MIANFTSYRFIGILLFSIPMGLYIRGRHLKPLFISASIVVPISGFFMLMGTQWHAVWLIKLMFFLGSLGFMLEHVAALPFILRHSNEKNLSEGIALNFSVWSFATIISGLLINLLQSFNKWFFIDEFGIMMVIVVLSAGSFFFFRTILENEPEVEKGSSNIFTHLADYDWKLIFEGLAPMMIISIGAGLTIPFMNLYFNSVFGMTSQTYAILGSVAAVLVFIGSLITPILRRKTGYGLSISITQFSAIFFLFVLAATQPLSHFSFALWVAVGCFILRQPLMNMASPITSELVMKYVGPKNRELISATENSIWNASWFFSAKIFQLLRTHELEYYKIFIITACLYAAGTVSYLLLVKKYNKKLKNTAL